LVPLPKHYSWSVAKQDWEIHFSVLVVSVYLQLLPMPVQQDVYALAFLPPSEAAEVAMRLELMEEQGWPRFE
jgi:hypothetical protein